MQTIVVRLARKIGNYASVIVLAISAAGSHVLLFSAPEISLTAHSAQGTHLSVVPVGQTFTLTVSVKNYDQALSAATLPGLSEVSVLSKSFSRKEEMRAGTTVTESAIHYTVLARKAGTFTFGPATFSEFPGIQSKEISLEVIEKGSVQDGYAEPKLTFSVEKKDYFVGEKIPFSLRFVWEHPSLRPVSFEMPDVPNAKIQNLKKGQARTERKGNRVYQYLECTGELYPERVGMLTIPSLRAEYSLPREGRQWSTFFALSAQERRSCFSSEYHLPVLQLPKTDKTVLGIGRLTSLKASLSNAQVVQGEAVTLTLTVEGKANFEQMEAPKLTIPSAVRSYESKGKSIENGMQWEYVIQGVEEGSSLIPAQEIAFFNTETKKYETLSTEPLLLTILPGKQLITREENLPLPLTHTDCRKSAELPWWLFILLLLMPIGYRMIFVLHKYTRNRESSARKRKRIINEGLKKLTLYEKEGDSSKIAEVVYAVLRAILEIDSTTLDEICLKLKQKGYSAETIQEVEEFFNEAAEYSSFTQKKKHYSPHDLIAKGRKVLERCNPVAQALLFAGTVMFPLQGFSGTGMSELIPFFVWQLGIIFCWAYLWICYNYSSRLRIATFILLIGFLTGWIIHFNQQYRPRVRILQDTPLRVGPSESFPLRVGLEKHDEVVLVQKKGPWYYVTSLKGIGWITDEHLPKK